MNQELMTDYLPQVRCTPTMRRQLEAIAADSVARNIADHVRFAVERYIEEQKRSEETSPQYELSIQ